MSGKKLAALAYKRWEFWRETPHTPARSVEFDWTYQFSHT